MRINRTVRYTVCLGLLLSVYGQLAQAHTTDIRGSSTFELPQIGDRSFTQWRLVERQPAADRSGWSIAINAPTGNTACNPRAQLCED